jgi:hypothetical protein
MILPEGSTAKECPSQRGVGAHTALGMTLYWTSRAALNGCGSAFSRNVATTWIWCVLAALRNLKTKSPSRP